MSRHLTVTWPVMWRLFLRYETLTSQTSIPAAGYNFYPLLNYTELFRKRGRKVSGVNRSERKCGRRKEDRTEQKTYWIGRRWSEGYFIVCFCETYLKDVREHLFNREFWEPRTFHFHSLFHPIFIDFDSFIFLLASLSFAHISVSNHYFLRVSSSLTSSSLNITSLCTSSPAGNTFFPVRTIVNSASVHNLVPFGIAFLSSGITVERKLYDEMQTIGFQFFTFRIACKLWRKQGNKGKEGEFVFQQVKICRNWTSNHEFQTRSPIPPSWNIRCSLILRSFRSLEEFILFR